MTQVIDPWLETDAFGRPNVDFQLHPEDEVNLDDDQHLPIIPHEGLDPQVIQTEPPPEIVEEIPPPPPDDTPETWDLEDGTKLILKKEKGWWVGSVVGHAGGVQNYNGQTKNELIKEILKAQANATKKIRELNIQTKKKPVVAAPPPVVQGIKDLTADEVFEIKTQLDSNPDLAFSNWFQRKTGLQLQELVDLAKKGAEANQTISIDTVNTSFMGRNPSYYGTRQNFNSLVSYLAEYKLGKVWSENSSTQLFEELAATGNWTVDNLEEAFTDLSSIGKLEQPPKPTPPVAVPVTPEPAPAPRPESRIVKTVTRPRAGLGLRQSDVTPAPPPQGQKPPSAEDLENMTDEQISNLLTATRRYASVSRRS